MTEQIMLTVPLRPIINSNGELIKLENHFDGVLPDPLRIVRSWIWFDGGTPLDSTITGNVAIGIDPGGQYLAINGLVEKTWPVTIKCLGIWEAFAGGSRQTILEHNPPVCYRSGDTVISGPELFGGGTASAILLMLSCESETGDLPITPDSAYAHRAEMTAATNNNPVACLRSQLPGPTTDATQVRVHIQSHHTQMQIENIDKMSVGVQSSASSTISPPVRLTFGTRDGYRMVPRQGIWSDWVSLSVLAGQNILVTSLMASAANRAWSYRDGSLPSWVTDSDSVDLSTMSGSITPQTNRTHVVDKLQYR